MPTDRSKYPTHWKQFSRSIREDRAKLQCECVGECGLHRHTPPAPRRCTERHMEPAKFARGKVVLTTAHLCTCDPLCAIAEHVKAMCNRCHLRVDIALHVGRSVATRMRKKEKAGQQVLITVH